MIPSLGNKQALMLRISRAFAAALVHVLVVRLVFLTNPFPVWQILQMALLTFVLGFVLLGRRRLQGKWFAPVVTILSVPIAWIALFLLTPEIQAHADFLKRLTATAAVTLATLLGGAPLIVLSSGFLFLVDRCVCAYLGKRKVF